MNVPQTSYQQSGLMYQDGYVNQYDNMSVDGQPWNQNQSKPAYHLNTGAYTNSWSASSSANPASYAQSGVPPQYTEHQLHAMSYEIHSQSLQNFDTPQVQSAAGPARVPRRQNAQEKVIQDDPTRKSSASRNERSWGRRGDGSSSARSAAQSKELSTGPSEIPVITGQNAAFAPAQLSSIPSLYTQGPSRYDNPTTTGGPSPTAIDDENAPSGPKKKSRLTNLDRRDICIYQRDTPGVRQEDIAKRWGVERSSISKILKEKNKWLSISINETVEIVKAKPPKFEHIEEKLKDWLLTKHEAGSSVSDKEIHDKALQFAHGSSAATAKFKASHGWVDAFKLRHGICKGIYLGHGTANEQNRALGNGHGNIPDPLMNLGPTMMDDLCRTGEWDPNAAARDVVYDVPMWKVSAREILEKHQGRWWHQLTKEEQEASKAAGDHDMYPPYKMAVEEAKLEDDAMRAAEEETVALQKAAIAAGEPFDFKATFDEIIHEKLGDVDYETIDVPELDVPHVPGQHPDDIEPTPGPSGERAHEAIWDVIRFCMPRRGRVFSNAHCAVLLEIWARTMIIFERQRRAGQRRLAYEEIYYKDRKNDEKHAAEMITEKERDFALNPTGEPTGRDIIARQTRKEDLEALRELKTVHDELVEDPKAAAWLEQVHDAQREDAPDVDDEAPTPSGSTLPPIPPTTVVQPAASSSNSSPNETRGTLLLTPPSLLQDDSIQVYTSANPPPEGHDLYHMMANPESCITRIQYPTKPYRSLEEVHASMDAANTCTTDNFGSPPGLDDPGTFWRGLFSDSPDLPDTDMTGLPMS